MGNLHTVQWMAACVGLFFFVALGAIIGSFINVLVYRLPRGLNIVSPPSACPSCNHKLGWRENFPIFGWLLLGGRCRFCKAKISPEYVIVETFVALLFGGVYAMWFMDPSVWSLVGVDTHAWSPEWTERSLRTVWPMFMVVIILLGSLVAITLIDAKTFTIPLLLPWFAAGVALITHPLFALWVAHSRFGQLYPQGWQDWPWHWTIPTVTGPWLSATLGASIGLVVAALLLHFKAIPRSFSDYMEWEAKATQERSIAEARDPEGVAELDAQGEMSVGQLLARTIALTGPALAGIMLGLALGNGQGSPGLGAGLGAAVGLTVGLFLRNIVARSHEGDGVNDADPIWVQYPFARREMAKEIIFLGPIALLGALAWVLNPAFANAPPLWLEALGGSLLGLLVGGGIVWGVRILGTLAFGKEAMGLGDVHLMAAIGACLGWVDPLLAFFIAPFLGICWAIGSLFLAPVFKREGAALPFGPHLAIASVLVLLGKPVVEAALTQLMSRPIDLP
ncbi:MAG: prepilin peptidase [Phycisphaerales bacterium]|nr:prepilin peptidase [Phycisphaerales bacterium]